MFFEEMIAVAPVYVWCRGQVYHCNWCPRNAANTDYICGRGAGATPYAAMAKAQADAAAQGWTR